MNPDDTAGNGRRPENSRNDSRGSGATISTRAGSSMYSTPLAATPTPTVPTQATPGKRSRSSSRIASAAGA